MKCIFSTTGEPPRCDKDAQYIYLGKSYCAVHLEIRSKEQAKFLAEGEKPRITLIKDLEDNK